jgi:hypothetical protein
MNPRSAAAVSHSSKRHRRHSAPRIACLQAATVVGLCSSFFFWSSRINSRMYSLDMLYSPNNAHRQEKPVVAKPEQFQPFNLDVLRNFASNKPSRSREAYVPQTA